MEDLSYRKIVRTTGLIEITLRELETVLALEFGRSEILWQNREVSETETKRDRIDDKYSHETKFIKFQGLTTYPEHVSATIKWSGAVSSDYEWDEWDAMLDPFMMAEIELKFWNAGSRSPKGTMTGERVESTYRYDCEKETWSK